MSSTVKQSKSIIIVNTEQKMKKIPSIVYVWLIRVHLALSECYDTTYSRCDKFNQFDGYIMSYDAGKLLIFQKGNTYYFLIFHHQ